MSLPSNAVAEVERPPPRASGPQHVAIIMDGNGRWAEARGWVRAEGHRRGVEAVRRVVRRAGERGVRYLTLFSFSSENWSRPAEEIADLFALVRLFIKRDLAELDAAGVRIRVIGSREGIPDDIRAMIEDAETRTRDNQGLTLIVAFNYGARDEIARAVQRIAAEVEAGRLSAAAIDNSVISAHLDTAGIPDPDLLIRTSGEQRLSNFLLWQCAYAEFVFLPVLWPDFTAADLDAAIEEFEQRERRFGGVAVGLGG